MIKTKQKTKQILSSQSCFGHGVYYRNRESKVAPMKCKVICEYWWPQKSKGFGSLATGVVGSCELPDTGVVTELQSCARRLAHPSALKHWAMSPAHMPTYVLCHRKASYQDETWFKREFYTKHGGIYLFISTGRLRQEDQEFPVTPQLHSKTPTQTNNRDKQSNEPFPWCWLHL